MNHSDAAALASHELDRQRACERDGEDSAADEDRPGERFSRVTCIVSLGHHPNDESAEEECRRPPLWDKETIVVEDHEIIERVLDEPYQPDGD